jgi:hypothetical protein
VIWDYPDRPITTVPELARAVLDLVYQLKPGAKSFPIANQTVGTAVTAIRHGLRGAPQGVSFEPGSDCRWWVPTANPPDATYVYLQASVSVVGTVRVHP